MTGVHSFVREDGQFFGSGDGQTQQVLFYGAVMQDIPNVRQDRPDECLVPGRQWI